MQKSFIPAFISSALFSLSIFISTMLTHYRGIDYPYLIYATAVILFVSTASAYFVSKIVKDSKIGASIYSIILSLVIVCFTMRSDLFIEVGRIGI